MESGASFAPGGIHLALSGGAKGTERGGVVGTLSAP